jgi:hypothetical protein
MTGERLGFAHDEGSRGCLKEALVTAPLLEVGRKGDACYSTSPVAPTP